MNEIGSKSDSTAMDAVVELSFAVHAALSRVAAVHDLSLIQLRLLGILRDREPSMMELAAFLALDKSSVSGLVSRAEARGYVKRTAREDDRRAVCVSLTGKGRLRTLTVENEIAGEIATLLAPVSTRDRKLLAAIARRIVVANASAGGG